LIARIRRQAETGSGVLKGIGDDCAVLRIPSAHEAIVTTDFSLEGIHFRREWHSANSVGHRCLTRGLSDIAAMGGQPIAAFLSLALPKALPQAWVNRFVDGLTALAGLFGVTLAGGDTSQSPGGILADIVVLGSVPRGRAILRSGARPGDRIYVTGVLGSSAFILEKLLEKASKPMSKKRKDRHFFPQPRIGVGKILRQKNLVSSMIDISDGLSTDLAHICEESGVGADVRADLIPRDSDVGLDLALHGGEDYDLLFTSNKVLPQKIAGVTVTEIGRVIRSRKMFLITGKTRKPLRPQGWEHFKEQRHH